MKCGHKAKVVHQDVARDYMKGGKTKPTMAKPRGTGAATKGKTSVKIV